MQLLQALLNYQEVLHLNFFQLKKVFLNGMNIENNSAQLKPGDILVIRGFGKFIFDGCGNETRKGRVYVHMRRY